MLQISMCQRLMHYFYLLLLLHYRWWLIKAKYTQHIYIYMLLGENEFLPKIFKLCSNLSLFSNYLVSCSCFGTRFFENWVPHITWFYHFWIMWKFCHTRLRRCGFTLFKKFQLQLNFLKIKFHRFFFWYHYLLLVLANSSQFWKEKKSVTRY